MLLLAGLEMEHCSPSSPCCVATTLLCCLERPRAAKPLMARPGIIRLLSHSLGERMRCPGLSVSDEPGFPLYSPLLHGLADGDVPHKVSEQYVLRYNHF